MKRGFNRLKGLAAAGTMGLGLLAAGSARAVTISTRPSTLAVRATFDLSFSSGATTFTASNIGLQNSVMQDQSITTTGGFAITSGAAAFGIADAGTTSSTDYYDGGLAFAVGNVLFVNPDNTVDLTANVLTTDTVVDIVPGLNAQIQYHFDPLRPVFAGLFSVTNTSASPIATTLMVMGNYGSDIDTTVQATSNGNLIVDDSDLWVVTDDRTLVNVNSDGSDPTATIATHGTGAPVLPKTVITLGQPAGGTSARKDNYGYRYNVTIPAGATVRVLLFNEMSNTVPEAVASAPDFESLEAIDTAGLVPGFTAQQRSEIINYFVDDDGDGVANFIDAFPNDPTKSAATEETVTEGTADADDDKKSSGSSMMNLPAILTMFGLLSAFRFFRKK